MFKSYLARTPKQKTIASNKALFVIGDVHGEFLLLKKLIREIEKIILRLPKLVKKEIVFLGDYIDRGTNSKKTITILINFQKRLLRLKNIKIIFLCGNHDEFFYKIINFKNIVKIKSNELDLINNPLQDLLFTCEKNLAVSGLKRWINIGGGISTITDYCPKISDKILKIINQKSNINQKDLKRLNELFALLKDNIPSSHKFFFKNLINNLYHQIGDFIIIHAGVFPNKTLKEQGIGNNVRKLNELTFLRLLMIRDEFLWTRKLNKCKHYIIHGHTPSEVLKNNMIIAYTYKNYRLCLDTKVYAKNGSLTCFYKYHKDEYCISISKKNFANKCVY